MLTAFLLGIALGLFMACGIIIAPAVRLKDNDWFLIGAGCTVVAVLLLLSWWSE